MHQQRMQQTDARQCARGLAGAFTERAWDLIEQADRTPVETTEMVDAAHAARALWRMATGSRNNIEALRAHQTVSIAAYRARDAAGSLAAARLAASCEWIDGPEITRFDSAMTHAAMYLATLAQNGFTDPEPLMAEVASLPAHDRELLSRILPWPKARFERTDPLEHRSTPREPCSEPAPAHAGA
ncbi:MAG: hypothetical protein RL136_2285 [Planctomycetota bacterium]|jgi:hypothetical protein